MEISYHNRQIAKSIHPDTLNQIHGVKRAKRIRYVMSALTFAPSLATFWPPESAPHRIHAHKGTDRHVFTADLDGMYRLYFYPATDDVPLAPAGGIDWATITAIVIWKIDDPH